MSAPFVLRVPPEWEAIKALWDPCQDHLGGQGLDPDVVYALSMAAQELLENAVKYGAHDDGTELELTLTVGTREVTVEVKGRITPDPRMLTRLDETIQWIRGFQDPFQAYVERLEQVSAQPFTSGESGLGLTRVAYEARCLLDFYLDDPDLLAVCATYQPGAAP